MARAALRWSIDDLADRSKVGRATIARFETGTMARDETVNSLRRTLEDAGVILIGPGQVSRHGDVGIRLSKPIASE
jgi:transcriptional regulator with XRE-family HTH domain